MILLSLLIMSRGTVLRRPDFRLPFSMMVVGPSASNFFQGGDSTRTLRVFEPGGGGVESRTRRRFAGRSSSGVSLGCAWPLVWPFVEGGGGVVMSRGESGGVDRRDKGESAPESASSRSSVEGFRLSVLRGSSGRGDEDGGGGPVVSSPVALPADVLWGELAVGEVEVQAEAAGAEACEADALGSVIATRGERGIKEGKGVAISAESASGEPKMMSAVLWKSKLSNFEVCA